jgi:hypothetical protein
MSLSTGRFWKISGKVLKFQYVWLGKSALPLIWGEPIDRKADDIKLSHILAQILFAEAKEYPQQP